MVAIITTIQYNTIMKKLFKWMLIFTGMTYMYIVSVISYYYFEDILEDYFITIESDM
jgi:hypothetical protein